MTVELRDVALLLSVVVALVSMVIVSRNARRATAVQAENVDLARIRDLRAELKEAKQELDEVKGQVHDLSRQLTEANDAAMAAYRERAEMLRWARMPGMSLDGWLERFDNSPPTISGRIDP